MLSMQLASVLLAVSGVGDTVLLDFQATWCGPCRSMEPTTAQLIAAGYPVRKVDVDREPDLAASFHVTGIPCFVMVVDGKEVDRKVGATTLSTLQGMLAHAHVNSRDPSSIADTRPALVRGQSPDPPLRRILPRFGGGSSASPPSDPFAAAAARAAQTEPGPDTSALMETSVRLTIEDPKGFSYGSGTLIDARDGEALVLTCGHIFRDSGGKGKITVDLFTPTAQTISGQLVSYDLDRDIGLVAIQTNSPLRVARVADKNFHIALGDKVVTIGCNNGGTPTAVQSKIIGIDKFGGPHNVEVAGQPIQGRSGGGLYASDGTVIGVCNAADPADNQGLFAAAETIRTQLDQSHLSAVYRQRKLGGAEVALVSVPVTGKVPSMPNRMPASELEDRSTSAGHGDAAARLAAASASGAEVICVVRTPDGKGQSELIVLDRASSTFLEQLAAERRAQEGQRLTSMEISRTTTR